MNPASPSTPLTGACRRAALAGVITLAALAALGVGWRLRTMPPTVPPQEHGWAFCDFRQYWLFAAVRRLGRDPYQSANYELALHVSVPPGNTTYCPPWFALFFEPVWSPDFRASALAFCAVSMLLLLASTWLAWNAVSPAAPCPVALPVVFLGWFPAFHALFIGQISPLIAFAGALLFRALARNRPAQGALAFVILSIKPHLAAFLAIPILVKAVRERRLQWILWPGCALLLAALAGDPRLIPSWLRHIFTGAPPLATFLPATLGAALRRLAFLWTGADPAFASFVPALAAVPALLLSGLRPDRRLDSPRLAAWAAWAAIACAPYVWSFDMTLLMVPLIFAAAARPGNPPTPHVRWWAGLAVVAILPYIQAGRPWDFWHFFWIPWACLPLMVSSRSRPIGIR